VIAVDRAYRLLLRTLPDDLRAEFGDDMAQLFRDQCAALAGRPLVTLSFLIAAAGDVLREAVAARAPRRRLAWPSWRTLMQTWWLDLRHGFRLVRRYPAASLLSVATLALGIGANSAIFSVVDAVILRALPYPNPDRLVMVWEKRPREGVLDNVVSPADFLDWQRRQTPFTHVAALIETGVTVTGAGDPVQLDAAAVSASFFDVLGVRPALGRLYQPGDDTFGNHRLIILTHHLWMQRFNGDSSVVGRKVSLNGNPWEIIGVLPASFRFRNSSIDLWATLVLESPGQPAPRMSHQLFVFGRLKDDVTLAQAREAMDRLGRELEAEYPSENEGHGAWVTSMRDEFVGPVSTSLLAIFAGVGLVLLIGCVNVASLQLARGARRAREMSVRAAIGASRGRLMLQTLTEQSALAIAGAVAGFGIAWAMLAALPLVLPEQLSVVNVRDVTLDARVFGFALVLAVVTTVLVGVLPARAAARVDLVQALGAGGRGAAHVRRRARAALVVGEVALAALTLVGAGLVLRSFASILSQPLGFDPSQRLALSVSLPGVRYPDAERRARGLDDIERAFATLPTVTSSGAINLLPLSGGDSRTGIGFEGREQKPGDPPTRMHPRSVTPGYFKTMSIPIMQGRGFTNDDHAGAELVAIISEASVRRFYPAESPIGKRVRFGGTEDWRTIVGVAGDMRHWGLTLPINPMIYVPQAQMRFGFTTFVLRASGDPGQVVAAARARLAEIDPLLPLGDAQTLDEIVAESVRSERAQAILLGAFGALALVLSIIGIFGVTSQVVAARVPEFGVRLSLGARPRQILRHVVGEGLLLAAIGIVVGCGAGVLLMRYARSLLFEVAPWDPLTVAGVVLALIAATLGASLIPARRAMSVDPVRVLKSS
jgi:putative ABC transport system permease protein